MTMKVFADNTVLSGADINEYMVNTAFAVKPNDESRSSTATATSDSDLSLHVDANKIYVVDLWLTIFSSLSGGNFKCGFNAPAGSTFNGSAIGHDPSGSGAIILYSYDAGANDVFTGVNPFNSNQNSGFADAVRISGILNTAGTAGNLVLKWAQSSSNAVNTTVKANSSMLIRRVS